MKRRDFLKGITAIAAISAAPKLIASEAERQLADAKILHNGPVRGIISKGDLTEESLGQLLDEIGDEPISYNWSEVYVDETGFHTGLKVEAAEELAGEIKFYTPGSSVKKFEAGEDLFAGELVWLGADGKAYRI